MEHLKSVIRQSILTESFLKEDDAGDPPKTLKVKDTAGKDVLSYFYSGVLDNYKLKPDQVMAMIGGGDIDKGKQMFVANFNTLRKAASSSGKPPRAWMPVIKPNDIPGLVRALKAGQIDIAIPHADLKKKTESFLSALNDMLTEAPKYKDKEIDMAKGKGQPKPAPDKKTFLKKGTMDNVKADDIVRGIKVAEIPVKQLKPSQDEIYGSKIALNMTKMGPTVGGKTAFGEPDIIVTSDNYILDGHHRWATAWAGHPSNKIKVTVIPLPLKHLFLVLRAYGAALGNPQQS